MARNKTVGAQIDELYVLREKIRKLDAEANDLKKKKTELEEVLMSTLDSQDNTIGKGKKASVSILETDIPSVKDWDLFYKFISRNKAWFLLQRRANSAPYREMMEARRGKAIPGVETITQRKLNLRVIPD